MGELGKDIARKCGGLPLTARILGSLLYSKDETYWSLVKDNEIWDAPGNYRAILVIKLSYDNLPLHLKKCFSFCSIFPRGQKTHRESLIRLWMAEELIEPSDERNITSLEPRGQKIHRESLIRLGMAKELIEPSDEQNITSLEEIGNEYFNSLLWSSFFQDVEKDEFGDIENCRMHDFVHDFSQMVSVSYHDYTIVKFSEMENINDVRRIGLVSDADISITFPKPQYNTERMRTVVGIQGSICRNIKNVFSYKYLRVLELRNYWIGELPDFSKLIHLRYLNLSNCQYVLSGQSIGNLYNLQTLILQGGNFLSELCIDIRSLQNLRHLDLSCTWITFPPDSVTSLKNLRTLILRDCQLSRLASDFGTLKHLRHLDVSGTKIKELPDSITSLRNLRIFKFNSCRYLEALPINIGTMTYLRTLDLSGTRIKELPDDSICTNMCDLEILKLAHCKLPKDIGKLKKLKHLTYEGKRNETPSGIRGLTHLETLPQFVVRKVGIESEDNTSTISDLNELEVLQAKIKICNLENVRGREDALKANLKKKQSIRLLDLHWSITRTLSEECNSNDVAVLDALQPHPDITRLKIKNFIGLKLPVWMCDSISCHLPKLVKLVLSNCCNCDIQLSALGKLQHLEILCIRGMSSVERLCDQKVDGGESSTTGDRAIPPLQDKVSTTEITEEDENDAPLQLPIVSKELPSYFPRLEKMTILNCLRLKYLQTSFPSLKELSLLSCHVLSDLRDTDSLTSLKKLTIRDCKQLKLSPDDLKCLFKTASLDIDTPIFPF